ncbi:MAG: hypothetical protein ACLSF6_09560 [Evtepia gabavorous]
MRLYQYQRHRHRRQRRGSGCLEVTRGPLGTYAVDYIKYDVSNAYPITRWVKLAYAVDPEITGDLIT